MNGEALRSLDLFSGIGGIALGLEWAGIETIAFCESDRYCRKLLAARFPGRPIYEDVRTLDADRLIRDRIGRIDLIAGGFPCQDVSLAGLGTGLDGHRSGLWREFFRLICAIRPRFVFVENVAALLARGMGSILGQLASIGYGAQWHCIPACAIGAPHERDRVWLVAYPDGGRCEVERVEEYAGEPRASGNQSHGCSEGRSGPGALVAYPDGAGRLEQRRALAVRAEYGPAQCASWWAAEPDVGRVADGIPARVDRLKGLGNAAVPAIAYLFGLAMQAGQ